MLREISGIREHNRLVCKQQGENPMKINLLKQVKRMKDLYVRYLLMMNRSYIFLKIIQL